MGYHLYREVIDHAPADLAPAELLVLLVLADAATDETRRTSRSIEELARWTRLKKDSVSKVLRRLAARGLEVRVVRAHTAAGRPVFAYCGFANDYMIPRFGPRRHEESPDERPSIITESPDERPSIDRGKPGRSSGQTPRKARTTVRESPDERPAQGTTGTTTGRTATRARTDGMTDEEHAAVLAEIRRRKPGANERLLAWCLREDGPAILAEQRAATDKVRLADQIRQLRQGKPCKHDDPGGASLHPGSGRPLCPQCRLEAAIPPDDDDPPPRPTVLPTLPFHGLRPA
jgi:predicted Fe-S protein YdhL (DUF1289 family)